MPASTCRKCIRPVGQPKADNWTSDTFLKAAEACHKGGVPFGIGLGETTDNVDTAGAIFLSFGAQLVDAKGNLTVKTDAVRQALEFYKKLIAFLPPDVGGLGRRLQQQMAGLRQGRDDHEPAERLGGRQARRAAGRRAMLDPRLPGRTEGPLRALPALLLEHLELLQEQGSGQEPAGRTCRKPAAIEKMVAASGGYDLPAFEKLTTLKVWQEEGPPKGTLYHYPNPLQPSDAVDRGVAGAAEDRPADLHAGDPDQDVPALPPGRSDGKDARLGGRRVRRLHAELDG